MSFRDGIELEEAAALVRRVAGETRLSMETVPVLTGLGRILAQDVKALLSLPDFPRSAMDGFAVRAEDLHGASNGEPLRLRIVGTNYAGREQVPAIRGGETAMVMTGGIVPGGADAVVKQEWVSREGDLAIFSKEAESGENCDPPGADFREGEVLLSSGTRMDASAIALTVSAGHAVVEVWKRPKVVIVSTGDEVRPARKQGEALPERGLLYDGNGTYLMTRLLAFGCEAEIAYVGDSLPAITEAVEDAVQQADFVLTTGGVSVGEKDYLPAVVEALGGEVLFHGIRVKPGMPTLFSRVAGTGVLSLSGNPYSASAMFEVLFPFGADARVSVGGQSDEVAAPMSEAQDLPYRVLTVPSGSSYARRSPVRRLLRGYFDGQKVTFSGNQRNSRVRAGIGCNCLVDVPGGTECIAVGERVRILLYRDARL